MDLEISGKKALVSGGDSGIGWCTAQLLLKEGVTVVITDKDQGKLDEAAGRLEAEEGKLFAFAADVTDLDALQAMHGKVMDAVGDIDILVQAAGITGAQGFFHEIDDAGWVDTITTDLLGPVRLVSTFLPSLRKGRWGRLVFIASEDGVQPYDDEIPYCSAKAGILALAKGLSRSYAKEGLLVNCVSPAFIHTPMTDAMMEKRSKELGTDVDSAIESFLDEERPYMELKRRGEPEEVAAVV
ncbi:MAG: short chain dehydrogenase/oxidoreductase, partial [Microbacteriaceae bacterium]|nr:short chain dehydrogenase/oxidoreductase [Microbacteriaceae bacterium]